MKIFHTLLYLSTALSFVTNASAIDNYSVSKPRSSAGLRVLEDIQDTIIDLAESSKYSVVNLTPLPKFPPSLEFRPVRVPEISENGSGIIIDPDGYIITNSHVIGDASECEVEFFDKSKLIAQVVGKDVDTDLALLKVTTSSPLRGAQFGDSSAVRVGQWVLAIGNPFGLERTVTLGVVSGVERENINLSRFENFIQTDASINPGNSGGPLLNLHGEIIGINTAIINFAQGIGFAIPSNMATQVIKQLRAHGRVVRGWLGVSIQPLTIELGGKLGVDDGKGVLVSEVFENNPALVAGMKTGDIITHINSVLVETPIRLTRIIAGLLPGSPVNIALVRDQRHMMVTVILSEYQPRAPLKLLP